MSEWGFDLVKLDFLYGAAPFGDETETRAGRMTRALEFLRECVGDKLILGCGVPLMPAFGIVDYCRVGCDVGLDWDDTPLMQLAHRERVSTKQNIGNSIFRRQLNGRAFLSDPDVFFLRDDNISLSGTEKRMLSDVCSVSGGIMLTSDNPGKYNEEKLSRYELLRSRMNAGDIRVETDASSATVSYELRGKRESFRVKLT